MATDRKLIGKKSGKGGSGASEAPNTLQSQATARIIEIISHGECVGLADRTNKLKSVYVDGVAIQNADGTYNFGGVQLQERLGLPNQDPFTGFSGVESMSGFSGLTIAYATPRTYNVTNNNIDAVRVTIQINGLSKQDSEGKLKGSTVSFKIERRVTTGAWEQVLTQTLKDKTTSVQQLSYHVDRPAAASATDDWDVRVTRTTPDASTVMEQNSIELSGVTEITDVQLQYADLAGVAMAVDSKIFGGQIAARSYDWVGMVLDVPTNYTPPDYDDPNNVANRVYTGLWDGTFKRAWTDNPAWILYAMLTDKQWGLGRVIRPDQVDKWALYQIAQYCDEFVDDGYGGQEPRYTINTQIASSEEAYAMLQSIASIFRGMLYWGSGSVTFVADQPTDPVKLVSPANVIGGNFTYQGAALKGRHSVVRVTWNDPTDRYEAVIEVVEDAEMIERFGWRPLDLIAYGCTSRGQAVRMGRWVLNTERYESELVTYQASFDHADVRPGNIIQLHDPHYAGARTAGRVTAITDTSATVDSPVTFEIGEVYTASFLTPDGVIVERQLTNAPGFSSNTLTWTTTLAQLPTAPGTVRLFTSTVGIQRARIASVTSTSIEFFDSITIKNLHGYTLYLTLPDGTTISTEINNPVLTGNPPFTNLQDVEIKSLSWDTPLGTLPDVGTIAFLGIPGEGYTDHPFTAVTDDTCTLTDPTELLQNFSYLATFTMPDGTTRTRTLTNEYGETSTLTWTGDLSALPLIGSMWGVSSSGLEPRLFRVMSVHEAAPNIFEITALLHDPTKYARVEEGLELETANTSVFQSEERPDAPTNLRAWRRPVNEKGVFTEYVAIFWDESESILVNKYKVSYRFDNNPWVDIPDVYSPSAEIVSEGPGDYVFKIIAVSFTGKESNALMETLELLDARPYDGATIERIRVEGSANVDQSSTVSFTGADLKIQWNVLPPSDWVDPNQEDWEDPYLKHYRVRFMTSADVVKNTFYTQDRRFVLTKEHNTESNGGTPLRTFKIGVALVDTYGTVYTEFTQEFTNPAPAAPVLTLTQTTSGVIATAAACADLDYGGTKIWVSTTDGFDPGVLDPIVAGKQYSVAVAGDPGTTYYARAAHFDDYSTAVADLNVSSQSSITLDGIVAGDLDTTPPAVPTSPGLTSAVSTNPDGSQIVILTASWTGVADSDLDHYEVALQEGAGTFIDYATTGTSYSWVVKGSTSYTTKVLACDRLGNRSAYTSTVTATSTYDTSAPSAPTSLAVAAGVNVLTLSWTNPTANDLAFVEIWEHTADVSGSATKIATVQAQSATSGAFTRGGLATAATRYYWLKAVDTSGNTSAFSTGANGTTSTLTSGDLDTTAPAVPTGLGVSSALTVNPDGTQIVVLTTAWTGVADSDLDHYEIALQEAAGSFIDYSTTATAYSWVVKGNVSYTVKVRAVDKLGNRSAYTATQNTTSAADTTAPSAPTSLTATGLFQTVMLTWTNPSATDLKSIEIWEHTANVSGSATKIATVAGVSGAPGAYVRTGLANSATRYYWVKAVDTSGNASAFSTGSSAATILLTGSADITAASVTGDRLTANTVTFDRLLSANFANLADNPAFEYADAGWPTKGTGWSIANSGGHAESGNYYATRSAQGSATQIKNGAVMSVVAGEKYYAKVSVKTSSTPTGGARVRIAWLDAALTELSTSSGASYLNGTTYQVSAITATAPAGAVYARLEVDANNSSLTTVYVDNAALFRMTGSVLIEDGAVVAGKIASAAIVSDEVSVVADLAVGEDDETVHISGSHATWRIWAGSADPLTAPWRVDKDGKMIASNFEMRTSSGELHWSSAGGHTIEGLNSLLAQQSSSYPATSNKNGPVSTISTTSPTGDQAAGKYLQVILAADSTVQLSVQAALSGYSGLVDTFPSTVELRLYERSSTDGSTWGSWAQVGSTATFTKVTSGTPTSSQYKVLSDTSYFWFDYGGGLEMYEETYYYPDITYPISFTVSAAAKTAKYYQYCLYGPDFTTTPWFATYPIISALDTDGSPSFVLNENSDGSVNFVHPVGAYSNLNVSATSAYIDEVTVTADYVILYTPAGAPRTVRNFSAVCNISDTGAGGSDEATTSSAYPGFLDIYIISDGSSDNVLATVHGNDPIMPAGFSYKKKVSTVYKNTSNVLQAFQQQNDLLTFMYYSTNPYRVVFSGSQGSINTPTFVSNPDGAPTTVRGEFTPSDAHSIVVRLRSNGANNVMLAASVGAGNWTAWNGANPAPYTVAYGAYVFEVPFETDDLFYASNGGSSAGVDCLGYRLKI